MRFVDTSSSSMPRRLGWGMLIAGMAVFMPGLVVSAGTTLSDPSQAYTVSADGYILLQRGDVSIVVVDNRAVNDPVILPVHLEGYNGMGSLTHTQQARNLFKSNFAGLNYEHIHDGTVQSWDVLFEPRRAPMELRIIDAHTAELYQPATPFWGVESAQRFQMLEDGQIEVTFECKPHRVTWSNDYLGFFWASYIHQPESLDIHFMGSTLEGPVQWIRGVSPSHGVEATHPAIGDQRAFASDPDFPLTLVYNFSNHRYDEPWYIGEARGMAFVQRFREQDEIRFTQSPTGGGGSNPAWDFQWFITSPQVGQLYQMVMRVLYVPLPEGDPGDAREAIRQSLDDWGLDDGTTTTSTTTTSSSTTVATTSTDSTTTTTSTTGATTEATTTTVATTTDSTSTTTTTIATTSTTSTTSPGLVYFVRAGGDDAWDGLAPTAEGGGVGPKLTLGNAVATVNAADPGYHTIDVGAGTFPTDIGTGIPTLTRTMRIVGQGVGSTFVDSPANLNWGAFMVSGAMDATAAAPILLKDFAFVNSAAANGIMVFAGGGTPDHVRLENVSMDGYAGLGYGLRLNNAGDVGNSDWTFRNLTARNIPFGETLFMRSNARDPAPRSRRWRWDGVDISDNANIWHSLAGNRWVMEAAVLTHSTWSRNGGNGAYGLNGSTHTDFLGRNVIYGSTIEDNNGYGVWAPRMGTGADLVIMHSTLRDTEAGHNQCTHVYLTIPAGIAIGQIRVVNTVFDSLGTCFGGDFGLYILDDGAVQTSPIELKNVAFNNCGTGLFIGGGVGNLWYIDPTQSGATISGGGTLVSGGRMTYYGDANLDGVVNVRDTESVIAAYPMSSGATWATGDFDGDGDFDADDLAWLPPLEGLQLIVK